MSEKQYLNVPLDSLVVTDVKYRPVYKERDDYERLKFDIQENGIMFPIIVRSLKNEFKQLIPNKYEIVDGGHRFSCATELGFDRVPIIVDDNITDDEVIRLQMSANERRLPTKLIDKLHQVVRYITNHPEQTQTEVAAALTMWPADLSNILKLKKLSAEATQLVSEDKITACNAFNLAKYIPEDYQQDEVLTMAQNQSGSQFLHSVMDIGKAIKAQKAAPGTAVEPTGPSVKIVSPKIIKEKLDEIKEYIESKGDSLTEYDRGRYDMLKEICSIDERSLAVRNASQASELAKKKQIALDRKLKNQEEAMAQLKRQREQLQLETAQG